jgi:polysaccharide chain length determinant protein (PEP-CTERM system associated)
VLPGKKFTPEDILRILWRGKWLVAGPFVAIFVATAVVAWRLPERYRSETLILIVPQRVPDAYVRSTVTTPTERSASDRLETVKQQVLARTRLERLILDLNLYPNARRSGILEDVIQAMRRDIDVQMVPKGDAFRVGFTYSDRRLAVDVVNRLASAFIDESNQDRTLFAESTTSFLETQLEDARRRLEDLDKKLADYRTRHAGELPTEREANLQVLAASQAQVQTMAESINRDRDRRYLLERTLTELSSEAPASAPPPTSSANADPNTIAGQTVADQLQAARTSLRSLELRFTGDHPDVKRARRMVADLEVKAQQEALQKPVSPDASTPRPTNPLEEARQTRIRDLRLEIEGIDRTIASKQAEEKSLVAKSAEYQRRVEAAPARESELTSLLRDYDTVQKHYANLLAKQEDSKIAANLERRQIGEQFRTLDQARVPDRPVSPNRPLIDLAGAVVGLAIGLGIVAFLQYRDDSFHTDEEIVRLVALPVVAMIPQMVSRAERKARRRRTLLVAATAACVFLVGFSAVAWWFLFRG